MRWLFCLLISFSMYSAVEGADSSPQSNQLKERVPVQKVNLRIDKNQEQVKSKQMDSSQAQEYEPQVYDGLRPDILYASQTPQDYSNTNQEKEIHNAKIPERGIGTEQSIGKLRRDQNTRKNRRQDQSPKEKKDAESDIKNEASAKMPIKDKIIEANSTDTLISDSKGEPINDGESEQSSLLYFLMLIVLGVLGGCLTRYGIQRCRQRQSERADNREQQQSSSIILSQSTLSKDHLYLQNAQSAREVIHMQD